MSNFITLAECGRDPVGGLESSSGRRYAVHLQGVRVGIGIADQSPEPPDDVLAAFMAPSMPEPLETLARDGLGSCLYGATRGKDGTVRPAGDGLHVKPRRSQDAGTVGMVWHSPCGLSFRCAMPRAGDMVDAVLKDIERAYALQGWPVKATTTSSSIYREEIATWLAPDDAERVRLNLPVLAKFLETAAWDLNPVNKKVIVLHKLRLPACRLSNWTITVDVKLYRYTPDQPVKVEFQARLLKGQKASLRRWEAEIRPRVVGLLDVFLASCGVQTSFVYCEQAEKMEPIASPTTDPSMLARLCVVRDRLEMTQAHALSRGLREDHKLSTAEESVVCRLLDGERQWRKLWKQFPAVIEEMLGRRLKKAAERRAYLSERFPLLWPTRAAVADAVMVEQRTKRAQGKRCARRRDLEAALSLSGGLFLRGLVEERVWSKQRLLRMADRAFVDYARTVGEAAELWPAVYAATQVVEVSAPIPVSPPPLMPPQWRQKALAAPLSQRGIGDVQEHRITNAAIVSAEPGQAGFSPSLPMPPTQKSWPNGRFRDLGDFTARGPLAELRGMPPEESLALDRDWQTTLEDIDRLSERAGLYGEPGELREALRMARLGMRLADFGAARARERQLLSAARRTVMQVRARMLLGVRDGF